MTAMRSQTAAASSRSWVTNTMARPRRRRCSSRIAITSDWVVTSSEVVGSSASSSRGSMASAAAIITRCSRPPESSCGYWRRRRSASSMPTSRSSAITRSLGVGRRARRVRDQRLGQEVADAAHRVHVRARVLEDHRDVARPGSGAASRGPWPSTSCAVERDRRRVTCAPGGSSRITAREVIDLPAPDSPTSPTASPCGDAERTSWITGCCSSCIGRSMRRSRISSSRSSAASTASCDRSSPVRREVDRQPVAEQVERDDREHDQQRRRRATPAGGRRGSTTARWRPSGPTRPWGGCTPRPRYEIAARSTSA